MPRPSKRKALRDFEPFAPTFTERMELGKDRAAVRRASGKPTGRRGRRSSKPTAAEERAMYEAEAKVYLEKWAAASPCKKGRPASGGCTRVGCCSWHNGVKPAGPAPF